MQRTPSIQRNWTLNSALPQMYTTSQAWAKHGGPNGVVKLKQGIFVASTMT